VTADLPTWAFTNFIVIDVILALFVLAWGFGRWRP
jgi:hypothetical protein